ncbi:protein kinase domain-containing protein [Sorangium sp. So ce1335]|uniref:protein kinase domain-containing protein n=1 Tax=Sorangium sp. So ce1335 TaxID=3133335 RepID=UPI003F631021
MTTHYLQLTGNAVRSEPEFRGTKGLRPGQHVFDELTHRWAKSGGKNYVIVARGTEAQELVLFSDLCRATARISPRGDALLITDLLAPAPVPPEAVRFQASFKPAAPNAGPPPADQLDGLLLLLAAPAARVASTSLHAEAVAPPPPKPEAPTLPSRRHIADEGLLVPAQALGDAPLHAKPVAPPPSKPETPTLPPRRRIADEDLLVTAQALSEDVRRRLSGVPPATRRRFLPRKAPPATDVLTPAREFLHVHGVRTRAFLPEKLRALVAGPLPGDVEIDERVHQALRRALGVPLLNTVCNPASFGNQKLQAFLAALSHLPLFDEDRAQVWLAMASGVGARDRLAELEESAKDLSHAATGPEAAFAWRRAVLTWLREGLGDLTDDDAFLASHVKHLLAAEHDANAAAVLLRWRDYRAPTPKRRAAASVLAPSGEMPTDTAPRPRPGPVTSLATVLSTPPIGPLSVRIKAKGSGTAQEAGEAAPCARETALGASEEERGTGVDAVDASTDSPGTGEDAPGVGDAAHGSSEAAQGTLQSTQRVDANSNLPPGVPSPSEPRVGQAPSPPPCVSTLLDAARARLCLDVSEVLRMLDSLREAEEGWLGAPLDPARPLQLAATLSQAIAALNAQVARLPEQNEVAAVATSVDEIAAWLGTSIEAPLADSLVGLLGRPDSLDQLQSARALATRIEALLPDWIWQGMTDRAARASQLIDASAFRDEVQACLRWVEDLPATEQEHVRDLPDLGAGTLAERLRRAFEERAARDEREGRLMQIAEITTEQDRDRLSAGWPGTEAEVLEREKILQRLRELSDSLGTATLDAVREHLRTASLDDCSSTLRDIDVVRALLNTISNLTFQQIREIARRFSPTSTDVPSVPAFWFDPPLSSKSDGSASAAVHHARGVYKQIDTLDYGTVCLPVQVRFKSPLAAAILLPVKLTKLSVSFVTPQAHAYREEIEPLKLPAGTIQYDFEITVVLSRRFAEDMAARKRELQVSITGTGPDGKSEKTTLTWKVLELTMPDLRDPIPQNVEPEDMLRCRLGVERRYDALLSILRQGASSFFVYGPRRFGKTSLLRGVQKFIAADDVVLLNRVAASQRPLPRLWEEVAKQFEAKFSPRKVYGDLEDGLLPVAHAYDSVREEAAERGIRSIYVLVDEAQAMFAHPRREQLAERLKERMEDSWAMVKRDGKVQRAAVLFGFVGQGHLPKLISTNLRASLKEFHRFEFSDDEIIDLLQRTTAASSGGLQSSREAREHLAKLSGNLFILGKLLAEILTLCRESHRTWFIRADVDRASEKIEADFRNGDTAIWDWVRDPLNESDNLNDWKPSTAYPLALAWAGARAQRSAGGSAGRAEARALLRKLCPDAEPLDERLNEAEAELENLRVLNEHGEFKLPMLERLLEIRALSPRPLHDDAEREAAQRLGLHRVRRPPRVSSSDADEAPDFEGSQARIWRAEWNNRAVAVRAISLRETRARARFIHEVALLRKIGEAGDQRVREHLPRILQMGIADDDPQQGLVVYEWIPGYPLPEASMTEPTVAEVGLQMAEVLAVLERSGVVHRDIRPANVLLRVPQDDEARKVEINVVLIDFGLARAVEQLRGGPRSIVEGVAEFVPPEVLNTSDSSAWSTAGDVYSTGTMLRKLLKTDLGAATNSSAASHQLKDLLNRMVGPRSEDRPRAGELRERFRAIVQGMRDEQRSTGLADIAGALKKRIVGLPDPVQQAAHDSIRSLTFIRAGMLQGTRRYAAVAAMLEVAFRRIVKARLPRGYDAPTSVYLRSARSLIDNARLRAPAWLDDTLMDVAGRLRNAEHHPDAFNEIVDRALQMVGTTLAARDADTKLLDALDHAAKLLDELTQSKAVAPFIKETLHAGAPNGGPERASWMRHP